jgi:hypothetical protein
MLSCLNEITIIRVPKENLVMAIEIFKNYGADE